MIKGVTFALAVILIDQITKIGYEGRLNSTVAFTNKDSNQSLIHLLIIVVAVSLPFIWLRRPSWAIGLAIGGLTSNMIDRVMYGGVRDPIAYGPAWWNLADVISAIGLTICVCYWFSDNRKEVTHVESPVD